MTSRRMPAVLAYLHRARLGIDYSLEVEDVDLMVAELGLARGRKDLTFVLVAG